MACIRQALIVSLLLSVAVALVSCGRNSGAAGSDGVPAPRYTATGPVGPFFMTRYWSSSSTLEKAVWYFTADGHVYRDLQEGLTPADLARHRGPQGTFKLDGSELAVQWADGKKSTSKVERDAPDSTTFMWDMGIFSPIQPFASPQEAVGSYDGGEAVGGGEHARVAVAQSLDLKADGTFTQEGSSLVQGASDYAKFTAGHQDEAKGTWMLSGYSLVLGDGSDETMRRIAFPVDDDQTPLKPDHIFVGWLMFKKK